MYSYVQNVETPSRCCNYSYQILDKFCARQPLVRDLHWLYVVHITYVSLVSFSFSETIKLSTDSFQKQVWLSPWTKLPWVSLCVIGEQKRANLVVQAVGFFKILIENIVGAFCAHSHLLIMPCICLCSVSKNPSSQSSSKWVWILLLKVVLASEVILYLRYSFHTDP